MTVGSYITLCYFIVLFEQLKSIFSWILLLHEFLHHLAQNHECRFITATSNIRLLKVLFGRFDHKS